MAWEVLLEVQRQACDLYSIQPMFSPSAASANRRAICLIDQTEVFTDYRLNEPVIFFDRKATVGRTPTSSPSIVLTQRGGTVKIQGTAFTESYAGLPPLKPGTRVLCLLKQSGAKYQIVGWYYGVFEIENEMIEPLMTREDFAPDYRGRPLQDAEQSMLAVLQSTPGK